MSDLEEIKPYIASFLGACGASGVGLSSFCEEFENMCQEPVPFKKLGFSNLEAFLRSIPEACSLRMERGEWMAYMARTNETAYIVDMQEKTPIVRKKKKGGKRNVSGGGYGGGYGSGYGGGYGSGYGGGPGGYSSSMNNPTSFKNPYSLSRATPTSRRPAPTSSRPTPASMRPASNKNIGSSTVHFSPIISANGLSKPTPKDSNQNRIEPKGNWEEYGRKVEKLLENRKFGSLSADVERFYNSEYNEVLPKDWVDMLDQRLIKVLKSYDHGNKHVMMLETSSRIYSETKPVSFTSDVQSTNEQVDLKTSTTSKTSMASMTNQMRMISVSGQPIRSELDSTTEESEEEIYYSDESSSSEGLSFKPVPFKSHSQDEEIISDWSSSDEDEQTGPKIYSVKPKNNSVSSLVVNNDPPSAPAPVSTLALIPAPAPVSSVSRLRTHPQQPRSSMNFYVSPRMSGYIGPPVIAASKTPTNQDQRAVCICNRGTTVVFCTNCTKTFSNSRVRMECKIHPNRFMSYDLLKCSRCFSYQLKELQETM